MKYILTVFLVVATIYQGSACDGCSAFSRVRPNDYSHTLGVHFNQRVLAGYLPAGLKHLGHLSGLYSEDYLQENFTTREIRGRYRMSNRLAVFGIMPVKFNSRTQNNELREKSAGVGDPSMFAEYRPFLPKTDNVFKFMLNLRVGVKFPLGETRASYEDELLDHDFQLSSGSYDGFLGSELYAGTENLGIVFSQLYRKNMVNTSGYKFGDVYSAMGLVTYRINNTESTYSLAVGPQFEVQTEDEQSDYILEGTSREIMSAALRADYSRGKFENFATLTVPINQKITELETLPLKYQVQIGINYLISKK